MLKRIFWLALIALGGWLLWNLWRQRENEYRATIPQLAPIAPPASQHTAPRPAEAPPAEAAPDTHLNQDGTKPATPDVADADTLGEVVGYCTRCREKRPIRDAHEELTENGRRAARGTCPVCDTNIFTFLPKKASE